MRSRTEMVTTTLEESDDFDEESDLDDSEEDWKPEKKLSRPRPIKQSPPKSDRKRPKASSTPGIKKRGRPPKIYKPDNSSSEDNSDNSDNEPIQSLVNRRNITNNTKPEILKIKQTKEVNSFCDSGSSEDQVENLAIQRPLQRKTTSISKCFPDRNGIFELLVCKSELKDGIKKNLDLCLWRRDGSSLLQKYIRDKKETVEFIYISSSVYSCWEDSRRNDFYDVRVQCYGETKLGKVKVLNIDELEKISENIHTDEEDVEEEIDPKVETFDKGQSSKKQDILKEHISESENEVENNEDEEGESGSENMCYDEEILD